MKEQLKLVCKEFISVNHYLAYKIGYRKTFGKSEKLIPYVQVYETSEAKKFKREFIEYIKKEVKNQEWKISKNCFQHYYVDCYFYFPRVDMDVNNYFKCTFDAITESKCVWIDDNQSLERINHIVYDPLNPRIEMIIHPVDYIGIFDNQKYLTEFENKCKTCTRYARNCSLLSKAKEGRIQEEIDQINNNYICKKYKEKKEK